MFVLVYVSDMAIGLCVIHSQITSICRVDIDDEHIVYAER